MRSHWKYVLTAAALLTVSASAQAQLVVNGINACFNSHTTGSVAGACSNGTGSTRWSLPGSFNDSDSDFLFDRNSGIAGPGGGTGSVTFSGNLSSILYLGWFRFDEGTDNTFDANAKLQLDLFLGANTGAPAVSYNNLQVNYDYRSSDPERFFFSGAGWSNAFTVDGNQYRFRVVGFDYPHPGSPANYCQTYDAVPTPANTYYYDDSYGGKLCGQFERLVTTTPEPSTYVLMAAGLAGVFGVSKRRRRHAELA